jgi:hypothetical protein
MNIPQFLCSTELENMGYVESSEYHQTELLLLPWFLYQLFLLYRFSFPISFTLLSLSLHPLRATLGALKVSLFPTLEK